MESLYWEYYKITYNLILIIINTIKYFLYNIDDISTINY